MNFPPIRVAIAGLGGFAGAHHEAVQALEEAGECKLIATCDPSICKTGATTNQFSLSDRGVKTFTSLSDMLDECDRDIDVVTLPTPIPLHREQHELVVARGKACYIEKPPSLWWPEFLAMLKTDANAAHKTNVGFNFVGDAMRRSLKSRILSGEFGSVIGSTLLASWPRDRAYYERNDWAGKRIVNGKPVNDSCIGNATAHYVQNLLFWCGAPTVDDIASVSSVRAELSHAHPIESFDTVLLQAELDSGAWLRIGVTHTGNERPFETETIICANATVSFSSVLCANIAWNDGRIETHRSDIAHGGLVLQENLRAYFRYVRNVTSRPVTSLKDSLPFVALHELAFRSCPEVKAPAGDLVSTYDDRGYLTVTGIIDRMTEFIKNGAWPDTEPRAAYFTELEPYLPTTMIENEPGMS